MNLLQNFDFAVCSLTNNLCTCPFNYRIHWNNAK